MCNCCVWCLLSVVCYSLFVVGRWMSIVVCCLMFVVVRCSLFAGCCLMFVGRSFVVGVLCCVCLGCVFHVQCFVFCV